MKKSVSPYLNLIALGAAFLPGTLANGQTNIALGKPTTADSRKDLESSSFFAVDGNNSNNKSRWVSGNTAFPHWIEVDLEGSYKVSGLKFWTGSSGYNYPVSDFAFQSWDGDSWEDIYAESNSTNTGVVDVTFSETLTGRRVRLLGNAGSDNYFRLYEIEILGVANGLQVSTTSPVIGGSQIDPDGDIEITFNANIASVSTSSIDIKDSTSGNTVGGISTSISGSVLSISHNPLTPGASYEVIVPQGSVSLASNGSVINGTLTFPFDVAPPEPEVVDAPSTTTNYTADIEYVFDRNITLNNASAVVMTDMTTGTQVSGVSVTVSSSILSISHLGLTDDHVYRIQIGEDAVEGNFNGVGNSAATYSIYAGQYVIFESDFESGLDGFATALRLGEIGTSPHAYARQIDFIGAGGDRSSIDSGDSVTGDFVLSPLVTLDSSSEYSLQMDVALEQSLSIGLTTTAEVDNIDPLITYSHTFGSRTTKSYTFSPAATDDYYLIFTNSSERYKDQSLDNLSLRRAEPPAILINSPIASSSFLENDVIAVDMDAFGVSGDLSTVSVYDDETLIKEFTAPPYNFNWSYHVPGTRTLKAVAKDDRGLESITAIPLTVTFNDGTLPLFVHYGLNDGTIDEWTTQNIGVGQNGLGPNSRYFNISTKGSDYPFFSSPTVYLFSGETYTVTMKAYATDSGDSYTWGFLPTATAEYPANSSGYIPFVVQGGDWSNTVTITFSVPNDGGYHLTFFEPNHSGYYKLNVDDIRLIGNFNSAPTVSLTSPTNSLTTVAGANLTLAATASDLDGTISEVQFKSNGQTIATDSTEPYEYLWSNIPEGDLNITAVAIDNALGEQVSDSITVSALENDINISTYIGDESDADAIRAMVYQSDGTLVLAGSLDPDVFGVTPTYLNGATSGDRGVIARMSTDGTSVYSVTVVGSTALDISLDSSDNIHAALGGDGSVKLNPSASSVLWNASYSKNAIRIDTGPNGTTAVLISPQSDYDEKKISDAQVSIHNATGTQTALLSSGGQFTQDVAIDEEDSTIVLIGFKNIFTNDGTGSVFPVDIPFIYWRDFNNNLLHRGYDWGDQNDGDRWLNRVTNNMADSRGNRVTIGPDGYVYAGFEFDGGNTPFRYDPYDLDIPVPSVGGDSFHTTENTTTVPKVYIAKYERVSGAFLLGQKLVNRLPNGTNNTLRLQNGNLLVDDASRVHIVSGSAAGLPQTVDFLPGSYTGGSYYYVLSPDFSSREFVGRFSLSGTARAIAIAPDGTIALGGSTDKDNYLQNEWQATRESTNDGWFATGDFSKYFSFQVGVHPRLFFDSSELSEIRSRVLQEPYASMLAELEARRDSADFYKPTNEGDPASISFRAVASAMIYAFKGNESDAQAARDDIQTIFDMVGSDWANPGLKGLTSYGYATRIGIAYDLCVNSTSWDAGFSYNVSKKLKSIGQMIVDNGGSEQNSEPASNWQAARGGSGGLALLATDHTYDPTLIDSAYNRVLNYISANQGTGNSSGWNPEGTGLHLFSHRRLCGAIWHCPSASGFIQGFKGCQ